MVNLIQMASSLFPRPHILFTQSSVISHCSGSHAGLILDSAWFGDTSLSIITDRINLQIKCLWPLLIYRSGLKCGRALLVCAKARNNLTDGAGLCCVMENNRMGLDCSWGTRQSWQGGGATLYMHESVWAEGRGGCLSLTSPLSPIKQATIMCRVQRVRFHWRQAGVLRFRSQEIWKCEQRRQNIYSMLLL